MRPEQKLLQVVEGFIAAFGGWRRLREIRILLLLQQATVRGRGITLSELSSQSGVPIETVRRFLSAEQDAGHLRHVSHPNDNRATLLFTMVPAHELWDTRLVMEPLSQQFSSKYDIPPHNSQHYDDLLFVIDVLMEGYMDSIRIRGAKMALLVMHATLKSSGVSVSELARQNDAPLETVRRVLSQHVDMGHIRYSVDPGDSRKTLIVSADLDLEIARVAEINRRIELGRPRDRGIDSAPNTGRSLD